MQKYLCDDGNAEIEIEAESAYAAAQEYVDGGDWGDRSKTVWIDVYVTPIGDDGEAINDERERITIALDAEEPECKDGEEHEWRSPYSVVGGLEENPGVYGHGGGVIITEVCAHCGRYRVTDTWAQNRNTGEQGLESVEYRDADEASSAWLDRRLRSAAGEVEVPDGYTYHPGDDGRRPRLVRDADDTEVRITDDDLHDIVTQQSWDDIIAQFETD